MKIHHGKVFLENGITCGIYKEKLKICLKITKKKWVNMKIFIYMGMAHLLKL